MWGGGGDLSQACLRGGLFRVSLIAAKGQTSGVDLTAAEKQGREGFVFRGRKFSSACCRREEGERYSRVPADKAAARRCTPKRRRHSFPLPEESEH